MTPPAGLRVGVDGFNLALMRGTGVATYARTLVEALTGLGRRIDLVYGQPVARTASPALRETLFHAALAEGRSGGEYPERTTIAARLRRSFLSPLPRTLVEVPKAGQVLADDADGRLPAFDRLFTLGRLFYLGDRYLRRYGRLLPVRVAEPPAIMHWTYPVPVRMLGTRNVYTIHDLVPLRLPHLSLEDKAYHARLLHQCIASAAHIVTVSETSRCDILACLPISPDRVTNLHQPAPERFARALSSDALAAKLRTLFDLEPQGYFLFYGAIEPKKNVGRLIEAYLAADVPTPLLIVGADALRADAELRLLHGGHGTGLPGADRIRRIDHLPAAQLEMLVRGARAVLLPSLYEGFGLPALEAMQVGAPVLAGTRGALPEIVGEAALTADPYDVDAIAAALRRLDGDAALRTALSAAGRAEAARFAMPLYRARLDALHGSLLAVPATITRREMTRDRDVPAGDMV